MSDVRLIDANALMTTEVLTIRRSYRDARKTVREYKTVVTAESIANAPTIDAAPVVHGRWKLVFEDWRQQLAGDECSACGFRHYGAASDRYHYCPSCGAKMDGGAD